MARKASAAQETRTQPNLWRDRRVSEGMADPEQLLANPRNWRIHPKAQQDALDEVGWVQTVLVNQQTGFVVDGHLRVALAISKGEPLIPVTYVDLTPEEEGLVLATLDPIAGMAGTDKQLLAELVADLDPASVGLQALLAEISPSPVGVDPGAKLDQAEELRAKWGTERGQVWIVGDHRIMCGDAAVADDVARLMGGGTPLLCVTDPPYGVNYDPAWRNVAAAEGKLAYAARRIGEVTNDDRADWSEVWALTPCDVIYSWHPPGATSLIHAAALQQAGFALRMQIIWSKSNFPIGRGDYHVRHEPCWYAVREGKPARRTTDRRQTTVWADIILNPEDLFAVRVTDETVYAFPQTATTVWEIALDQNVEGGHSTQKPVECMARPIRNHDAPEVYDPFLGSGTTIVACEQLGRRGFGMEIEPKYVAVSLERLAGMGLEPVLE